MHRLSLNRLLHLIMFVPLVALAVFGATIIAGTVRAYRDIETVAALEQLVSAASWLIVGALNDELTKTHPFVASGADRERTAMLTARLVSDEAIRSFKRAATASSLSDPQAIEHIREIARRLEGLTAFRAKADARSLQRQEFWALLQPIAARLAELIQRIAMLTNDVEIKNRLLALHAIMQVNDGERIEAGRVENAITAGSLRPELYQMLLNGLSRQAAFGKEFANFGAAPVQERLSTFSTSPHGRTIEALRPTILAVNQGGKVSEQDVPRLREAFSARNALSTEAVQSTAADLTDATRALREEAFWRTIVYICATALLFVFVIGMSRLVRRAVRRLLGELTEVMQKIASGQLAVEVGNRDRSDEIGAMAQTVEVFKQNAMAIQGMERERSEQKDRAAVEKQATLNQLADFLRGRDFACDQHGVDRGGTAATERQEHELDRQRNQSPVKARAGCFRAGDRQRPHRRRCGRGAVEVD